MESFNPNKHLKEEFVSNLTGSSKLEIFSLLANFSILILIRHCIGFNWISCGSVKKDDNAATGGKGLKAYTLALIVDFLCIVVPYTLFLTVLADFTYGITILVFVLLLFLRTFDRNRSSLLQEGYMDSVRVNISSYRVSMMLATSLAILAVDFKIFPRRYAKTETYGTGLVRTNAFNLEYRKIYCELQCATRFHKAVYTLFNALLLILSVSSFCYIFVSIIFCRVMVIDRVLLISCLSMQSRTLQNALRSTSPLIILGFARLISTSSVNYQVHVGEYGVHWNFFFTLAAVAILTFIINVHPNYCGILGSLILIGYQALLLCGLNKYIMSEERKPDIFSQNKEGIFSIFGEDLSVSKLKYSGYSLF
ncbi:PREDICTED: uncharacterized protein At4g17910-like, partial [Erythranthe guttata]